MMPGFLLARAGVSVLVLEKHADFLRDFRGDTVHPSTLEVMHELGLLEEFLQRPHQEVPTLGVQIGDAFLEVADFTHLPTHCRFVALMPQWDFLDFLAEQAKCYPAFQLRMEAEVQDLILDGGRVTGLRAATPDGEFRVTADLVVGAEARHSTVRDKAGLDVIYPGAAMDVLWMRLSRHPDRSGSNSRTGRRRPDFHHAQPR
jgi:2-polyprenyl-6-methoxyphenol hydroxylase-like FAD-dependent oxidoreductase